MFLKSICRIRKQIKCVNANKITSGILSMSCTVRKVIIEGMACQLQKRTAQYTPECNKRSSNGFLQTS